MSKQENQKISELEKNVHKVSGRLQKIECLLNKDNEFATICKRPKRHESSTKSNKKMFWFIKSFWCRNKIGSLLVCTIIWGLILSKINYYIGESSYTSIEKIYLQQFITSIGIFLPLWCTKSEIIKFTNKLGHYWLKILVRSMVMIIATIPGMFFFKYSNGYMLMVLFSIAFNLFAVYLGWKLWIYPIYMHVKRYIHYINKMNHV